MSLTGSSSPNLLEVPMMPRFLALVAITISVLSCIHASAIDLPLLRATDRAALLSFKSSVWGNLSDWGSPEMCNWTGVTCDSRGRVIRLLLSNSNLTGVVSPGIGNLSVLEALELHSNQLSGNIPPQLGMLSQLVNLSLDNNMLNGPIPETLGLLKSITYLSLSDNNLNGSIPEAVVCNCSSLSSIDLSSNFLTGEIILSTQCQPLSLNKLILYNNGLTGIIPSSMSNFTSLEWLLLQSNFLGSVLPSKMFNTMSSLKFLYLSNNNFSGDGRGANLEPFLASLVNCTCLEELGLDSNSMRDKIPPIIGNLSSTNLSKLYLYDNKITGTIPHTIGNISSLTDLCIEKNMLEGTIPSEIFQPRQLARLVLANNQINGEIPKSIGLAQQLITIHMSYNGLQGTIPDTLSNLTNLAYLVLHHNQLSGAIPPGVSCSMILDLCYNKLTGRIPTDLAGPSTLQIYLNLSNNLLEGPLPSEFGNMDKIKALDLSLNKLSAAIPAQIKGCTALEYVNLSRNFLQGPLPSSIGSFPTSLHVLDVSLNRLTGTIPQSLQTSPVLWFANFSYNNFTGEVSSEGSFANLTADSFLDNPGLCGSILGMAPCRGKHGHFLYIAIIVIIAIAAILLAMVCIFYHDLMKICLRLTPPSFQLSSIPTGLVNPIGEKEGDHPRISYRELVDATDGFSEANLIGKGGYGHVYRGVLHGGTVIAVKALHHDYVGEVIAGSFERECHVLRSIRHRNLIRVITACSTPEFKAIVLPFMPNGSLDSLIHGPPGGGKPEGPQHKLDLDMLLSIASNIAEGMAYLHHHAPVKVVHCDLKPSNVLLDGDMTAIVSDFGISKLVINGARGPEMGDASTSVSSSITRLLQGSVGYIAPEYGLGGRPSTQGDVYSFGVMLLEMISGKRPTDVISEEGHGLHDWAKKRCLEHDFDAIAKCLLLRDSPSSVQPFGLPGCEMEAVAVVMELLELGVACSQLAPSMRPDMDDVAQEIACVRDGTWRKYRATDLNAIGQKKSSISRLV